VRLGIGSYAFRWAVGRGDFRPARPLGAVEMVHKAHALGVSLLQFADNLPLHELPPGELPRVREAAEDLGVTLEVGAQGFSERVLEQYLDIAGQLGARLVRLALDGSDLERSVPTLTTEIRNAVPAYRERGVRLAIENHFHFPSRDLLAIVEGVSDDAVGICLDAANSIAVGEWPSETTALLAPHAINAHLKDYDIVPDPDGVGFRVTGAPIGEGRLDAPGFLGALTVNGHDPNVLLEQWLPRLEDEAATIAREEDFLARGIAAVRALGLKE
jgi:sugar phosphate isomerase/epimerase